MRFSTIAHHYLQNLNRNKEWIFTDPEKIARYLIQQGIPPFEKIIDFQVNFSGLELTIKGEQSSTFYANLLPPLHISSNMPADVLKTGEDYYFDCGSHQTAQFWFVINGRGEIATYDSGTETTNIFFSSFDKFIETYAMEDYLHQNKKYVHNVFYSLIDLAAFEDFFRNFRVYDATSDAYNKWLSNETVTIHKGTWYNEPSFYLRIYGNSPEDCESLVNTLKQRKIVRQ